MAGFGKWIGGGLGWAFGGPIGAILGFTFGSMFDKTANAQEEGTFNPNTRRTTQSGDFAASLLVLSAAIMKADGKVLKSELDYVKQFLTQQFGHDRGAAYLLDLREILKQEIPLRQVAMQIKSFMDHASRLQLYHYLWGIAAADGQIHSREEQLLEQLANYLGISSYDFQSIRAMFVKEVDSAYKILEISPEATDEEVKKAYRKMAVKYHPDKVSHLGEEYQKAAESKFQALNEAYNNIRKKRGF
jgi:DnaJ like chaperone protein